MIKDKREIPSGVQELCRKLKLQLEELAVVSAHDTQANEDVIRRRELMEQLKQQLAELS